MENLRRVTGGYGGEAFLYLGKESTVLHDLGMACFSDKLIENIDEALGGRSLDYILLSHTHYDHMGALPYVLKRWPNAKVCGCKKTASVFDRPGALRMIVSMGQSAAEFYGKDPSLVNAQGIRVDIVLEDGEIVDLGGGESVVAYETKGHTDCSMSYFIEPSGLLFASESTGVLENENKMHTSVLKSFDESFVAAKRLKELPVKCLVVPHYGVTPKDVADRYFDWYIEEALAEKELIEGCLTRGMSLEEAFEEHKKVYWNEVRAQNHPYRAYKMNTEIIIKMIASGMNENNN
ncbi:MAG: MBL fold metallo-hydrolase [Firmicutes bacterium]|nr:MBL fold metallo-hydrolase [Bacillota bacterium]